MEESCGRRRPISSFFSCPKLLTGFSVKSLTEMEAQMSPTSILDAKAFSCLINTFWSESKTPKTSLTENRRHWDKMDSKRIGLGIVDDLANQSFPMVLFGSRVKIQSPSLCPSFSSPPEPPISSAEYGLFTPANSTSPAKKSEFGSSDSGIETPTCRELARCLSATEMELSEEYTCVISRGPNPRTTHIFDDCIVNSCTGSFSASAKKKKNNNDRHESFLSCCFTCKKSLGQGRDIYMYRGEQSFCSEECRYQEMIMEDEVNRGEFD